MTSSTASVSSFSNATVYTARDFKGYTLQHIKAMYPNRWRKAAHYFDIVLPEPPKPTIEQIKVSLTLVLLLNLAIALPQHPFSLFSSINYEY